MKQIKQDSEDMEKETYLGDGLYVSFDGFGFWLRAPRPEGDHIVCLEPQILQAFNDFVVQIKSRGERNDHG
jgi:hypothetical protein